MNDKLTLSIPLINAVLAYLGSRPYQEVFQLIEGLQNEAKSQVQPAVEEPKE